MLGKKLAGVRRNPDVRVIFDVESISSRSPPKRRNGREVKLTLLGSVKVSRGCETSTNKTSNQRTAECSIAKDAERRDRMREVRNSRIAECKRSVK
ncbi:MAG: hypothetical protein JWP08_774 [Bryobacterales bacterium]|nr:hypothetical protein [Bryobacterales bacterium]